MSLTVAKPYDRRWAEVPLVAVQDALVVLVHLYRIPQAISQTRELQDSEIQKSLAVGRWIASVNLRMEVNANPGRSAMQ